MKKYKYKLKPGCGDGFFIYIKRKFKWKLAKGSLSGYFTKIEYAVEAIKFKHVNEKENFKIIIGCRYTAIEDKK